MSTIKILLIDDNPSDYELARIALKGISDLEIVYVEDIDSFREIYEPGKFSAIISDYNLQNVLGTDILKFVKESERDIPFIIISGALGEERAVEILKMGATDYVLKDNLGKLPLALKRALKEAREKADNIEKFNELKRNEELLKEAQALAHIGNWELDFASGISIWSDETCRIYGISVEENKQTIESWYSFIHPDDLAFVRESVRNATESTNRSSFYHRIMRRDGSQRHIYSESVFIFDVNGIPTSLHGIAKDVTEQKEAEDEIRKNESKFRSIFESINDIYYQVDINEILTMVSPSAYGITGYNPEELIGKSILSYYKNPDERNELTAKLLMNEKVNNFETTLIRKDGNLIHTSSNLSVIKDSNNKPCGAHGICRDITEKKIKEELLKNSQKLNKQIIESSDQMFYVIKIDELNSFNNPLTFVSNQCFHYFGLTTTKLLENPEVWLKAVHPDDIEHVKKITLSLYETKVPATRIYRIKNELTQKYLWVEDYIFPLINKGGVIVEIYGSIKDISNVKKYILAIENQNKKLGDIAWTQSHIVRAPLARMMGLINLLDNESQVDEETNQLLKYILSSAHEFDEIIRSIIRNTQQIEDL